MRLLIGAGGTGGHLFPALAVLEQIESQTGEKPEAWFAGRADKIEANASIEAGYNFIPVDIYGINKVLSLKTVMLPVKIRKAVRQLRHFIREKDIQAAICTGAYISYPPGLAAARENLPLFLMESNVNPGKSIRLLSKKADTIFTSFVESKSYFPTSVQSKIICSGNPVRNSINNLPDTASSREFFGLLPDKKTVFVFGGSLGALSINLAVRDKLELIEKMDYQVLWQTGKHFTPPESLPPNIKQFEFIKEMDKAYAAADLVVSRSGATTIAELASTGKPSLLVPLASASNNEQYKNAVVFEERGAAKIIYDNRAKDDLFKLVGWLMDDEAMLKNMAAKAEEMEMKDSSAIVAKKIIERLTS